MGGGTLAAFLSFKYFNNSLLSIIALSKFVFSLISALSYSSHPRIIDEVKSVLERSVFERLTPLRKAPLRLAC